MTQADIHISKCNEAFLIVHAEPHVEQELADYFTFFAVGFNFNPLYKAKKWDGKIRMFNKRTKRIPAGLFRYIVEFAKERKYSLDFDPGMVLLTNFSVEEAKDYIDSLKINSRGKPLDDRDYQITAFAKSIRYRRSTLLSPTASGKSYIIYAIWRYLLTHGCKKGLIIVPTISLVEQMFTDFVDYATPDGGIVVEDICQKIYQGHSRDVTFPVTISTWQSIYEMPHEWYEQFDFIIGDEAHMFKASSLTSIMRNMVNAKYRIGTTGTLDDMKVHKLTIEGWFGPVCKVTTTKELIKQGHISDFTIKCLQLKHPEEVCRKAQELKTYPAEMDILTSSVSRNKFIRNLVLSLKGNTLLLFQYVDKHGNILYDMIKLKAIKGRRIFFVFGGTEAEERESVRRITEKENDAIIVASYGVFSTGINIRNLHNVIFASPSKSKIRVLQSIGRGLRLGDNKTTATIYDIADDLRVDKFVNHTLKHYAERVKMYSVEKFGVASYIIQLQ